MSVAVANAARSLTANWAFARAMAARELKTRNKGALLGWAWLILRPLILVAAYVTIMTYVLKVRLGVDAGPFDYTLHVLSGLAAWQAVQRSMEEAPSLVRGHMEVLKQTPYPIETLPVTAILTSGVGPAVSLLVYILLALGTGVLPWSVILLPLPVTLLIILVLGLSWVFMIAGVLLKDLREVMSVVLSLLVYASPVLLTERMVGTHVWRLILLNPLAHVVICFRDVLQGTWHPLSWLVFAGCSLGAFVIGAWVVGRTKIAINEYL